MSLTNLLADLRADQQFMANVAAWRTVGAKRAEYGATPAALHPLLRAALQSRGIKRLYSHQARCVELALAGENFVVVTPTASGKTLCYNLPVLHGLLSDPDARALYLFPTKALAHDQLAELEAWQEALFRTGEAQEPTVPSLAVGTYDGDTASAERPHLRRNARLVLSNPDMLHTGILPYHANWETFFAGLQYVVIDELHTYRGVFGSHVANVLRRLQRICNLYGSRPRFIAASATIANPQELAHRLVEQPVAVVAENGAPRGEKHVILYNPPLYDAERGLRRSSTLEAQELAARCVLGGLQTIVFGRSRLVTELLLTYLRERLSSSPNFAARGHGVERSIRGYRGGYLPAERRAIEAGLRRNVIRGVVATNALELGIDIGQLQAAVLCGYPGSIASAWQQMGRAGRTEDAALAILVATGGALDQYVVRHPEFIFERSPEHALINPDNLMLLVDQMRCAAFEYPFAQNDTFGHSAFAGDVLGLLAEQGDVHHQGERYFWMGDGYPARAVSLRSAGSESVTIQTAARDDAEWSGQSRDEGSGVAVIGEIDHASAPLLVHDGAIYLHEGRSYQVDSLDLAHNLALVHRVEVDYYTDVMSETEVEVLAEHDHQTYAGSEAGHGDLLVTLQVVGFRRVKRLTHETLGVYPLAYEPQVSDTTGYWLAIRPEVQAALEQANQWRDSVNDYGPNWEEQRARIRSRDGYRCSRCGAPESDNRQHDVHHVTPFRTYGYVPGLNEHYLEANRLDNLVLVCRTCHRRLEAGVRVRGGLDGLAYALTSLAPLYLMCDRQDIGVHVARSAATAADGKDAPDTSPRALPTIYIYERVTAGLGFSARLFELHETLLEAAYDLVIACACQHGCPGCVGPIAEEGPILLDTKGLTLALLGELTERRSGVSWSKPPESPSRDIEF